jgi:hypothetical protein
MGRALRAGFCALLVLAACGGDDDDAATDDAPRPIAALAPCTLLPEDEAARLSGGEVEVDDAPTTNPLGSAVACTYHFTEATDGGAEAGTVAASLVVVEPEQDVAQAVASVTAQATDDGAEVTEVDAGFTVVGDRDVRVIAPVETVVVIVSVVPADGEIDQALVDDAVAYTETVVDPVARAV